MSTAYDTVRARLETGAELRTPDKSTGKPFTIAGIDDESVSVRTARGGRIKISLFTFDAAMKYLSDRGHAGDNWLPTGDEEFQMVLNMENDRVRAASYVLSILGAAELVDLDGSRPNRVRLRGG
ncbi:MAG: hypothetical protein ACYTGN_17430 [Planctomycetota bacterium]|jgi:hypothetical protein